MVAWKKINVASQCVALSSQIFEIYVCIAVRTWYEGSNDKHLRGNHKSHIQTFKMIMSKSSCYRRTICGAQYIAQSCFYSSLKVCEKCHGVPCLLFSVRVTELGSSVWSQGMIEKHASQACILSYASQYLTVFSKHVWKSNLLVFFLYSEFINGLK